LESSHLPPFPDGGVLAQPEVKDHGRKLCVLKRDYKPLTGTFR
jgi:hypothetical protein